jgi:hypothetical protein
LVVSVVVGMLAVVVDVAVAVAVMNQTDS